MMDANFYSTSICFSCQYKHQTTFTSTAEMSWMDSWSRPTKYQAVSAPLYLTDPDTPYCQTCGRVISSRKSNRKIETEVKYCSERCRRNKLKPKDREIEQRIIALLDGQEGSGIEKTAAHSRVVKGDRRIVVTCEEVEEAVFGSRHDPEKVFGRRKNSAPRAIGGDHEWTSVDMMSDSSDEPKELQPVSDDGTPSAGTHVRPPQIQSDVNFSVGGERSHAERIEETPEALAKRLEGQKRAEEREMVRRAARRAVVFGFATSEVPTAAEDETGRKSKSKSKKVVGPGPKPVAGRRMCEALMNGAVIEPSFAKGNWSIRWREEV
jgi:hypothetical protein